MSAALDRAACAAGSGAIAARAACSRTATARPTDEAARSRRSSSTARSGRVAASVGSSPWRAERLRGAPARVSALASSASARQRRDGLERGPPSRRARAAAAAARSGPSRRACRARAPRSAASARRRASRASRAGRGRAFLLPISASASTARSRTHQSLSLRGLDQEVDGALVLGLVQDLDRGAADVLVLVADQFERRLDHARAADLRQRVGGPAAHPPVVVLDRLQQVLDVLRACRSRSAPRPPRGGRLRSRPCSTCDQVLDGVRVVGAHDRVDRLLLRLDVRVAQQLAEQADVDVAVRAARGRSARPGG